MSSPSRRRSARITPSVGGVLMTFTNCCQDEEDCSHSSKEYLYRNFPSAGTYNGNDAPSQPSADVPGRKSSLMKLLLGKTKECNISDDDRLDIAKPCNEEDGKAIKAIIVGICEDLTQEAWDMTHKNVRLCESCAKSPATTLQVLEHESDGPGQHPNTHCWECAGKDPLKTFLENAAACECGLPRHGTLRNCKTCIQSRDCVECGKSGRYGAYSCCYECYMKKPCSTCKKGTRMPGQCICLECGDEKNASKTCVTLNCKKLVMPGYGRSAKHCLDCFNRKKNPLKNCKRCGVSFFDEATTTYYFLKNSYGCKRGPEGNECLTKCNRIMEGGNMCQNERKFKAMSYGIPRYYPACSTHHPWAKRKHQG